MTMKRSSGEQQGPDPKRSRPHFFIDSLLGHHSTATNGLGRQQQEGEPNSNSRRPGAATASTTMASRKLRKSRVEPERRLAVESPPLDEANWLPARPDPKSLRDLNCQLDNLETWQQFDQLGTEMIITKSGRRMFPVLKLRFSGIRPSALYLIYMDLSPVQREHRFRYAYNKSQWQSGGKADKPKFGRLFLHTDSPFTGEQLAQSGHVVGFEKVKLTNNTDPNPKEGEQAAGIEPDQLLLNSMHKYRPRVHIFCLPKGHPMLADPPKQFRSKADLDGLSTLDYKTFSFPATQFVAVTAYQNQLVTQKKIELNPFAKGFRDQPKQENDGIPPLDGKYNGNMPRPTDSSAPHAFPMPKPPAPPIQLHRNQHQQQQNPPMWLANNLPPWALRMMLFWANPAQRRSSTTPIEESREEERTPVDDGHQNEDKATELLAENGSGRKKLLAEEDLVAITRNGSRTETGEGSPKEADGGQQIPVELTAGIQ